MDFVTALGRLLHDGSLRDAFAAQPQTVAGQLDLGISEQAALAAIPPSDLEFQADILLRKRFGAIQPFIPETLAALREEGWPLFRRYARIHWPQGAGAELRDATEFLFYSAREYPEKIRRSERNRLAFALNKKRIALHFVGDLPARRRPTKGLQILIKSRHDLPWELGLFLML